MCHRRYWSIRLHTYGELGDWAEIEKMAKGKKTLGGFEVRFGEIPTNFQ